MKLDLNSSGGKVVQKKKKTDWGGRNFLEQYSLLLASKEGKMW